MYAHFLSLLPETSRFSLGPSVGCFKLLKPLWTEPYQAWTCGCSSRSPKIGILNRSEFFGKASLGFKAPWASKWSSGGIFKAITNLMGFYCTIVTSLGTVLTTYWSVLLPVLLLCVFVLQAYGFSFPSALPLPLFLKESIQPLVVARSAAHASPISRQGSEAVIRAFPKISSATNAKIPFPKLPFSLKACLIFGDSTQNSLQWLIYSMESSRTRKKWRRGNIWRFLGCWSCQSSRAKSHKIM